jgi:uncharacterized membrane protein YoaK (UPF0700 family)
VITDLGIECARWFRFWRKSLSEVTRVPLVMSDNAAERPALPKILLLTTIVAGFLAGATSGALLTVRYGHASMLVAAVAVGACAFYAGFSELLTVPGRQ